jgi:O-antigen ligase
VMLSLAFSIMLGLRASGESALPSLRVGLTVSGLAVVIYHVPLVSVAGLLSPHTRLITFLNPSALGAIVAFTGISLVDYLLAAVSARAFGRVTILTLCCTASLTVLAATKSRTAAISFLAGFIVLLSLRYSWYRVIPSVAVLVVALLCLPGVSDALLRAYQLDEAQRRWRPLETLTGRTDMWAQWLQVIEDNPLLGTGPGGSAMTRYSAHNGLLQNLGEVGLLGTLPLIAILLLAARGAFLQRRRPEMFFAIACLVAGIAEAGAESEFFSFGTPCGLLFLLSIATLAAPMGSTAQSAVDVNQSPGEVAFPSHE